MQVSIARPWIAMIRVCLLVLGLVSCGDGGTTPEPQVVVSVSPVGPLTLNIGDTVTVRATVQNATRTEVSYSSSNPLVVSVSSAGLVRALAAGTASVVATSVQDPKASATVQVQVQPDKPASVIIEAVLNSANLPVDPTRVQGVIFAQVALERGSATRLDLLVDTVVVSQQTFSATAQSLGVDLGQATVPVSLKLPVNTAAFDSITGTPTLHNGPVTISARLLSADNRVLASHTGPRVVLSNPNLIVARVSATKQATDATGLRWVDGDVMASVMPVMFDRGLGLARVEFTYRTPGGAVSMAADSAAPFAAVFEEKVALADVTDPSFQLSIGSATTAGNPGPSGTTTAIRYDNQPPTPGALVPREWVGATYLFSAAYNPAGESDRGVGRIRARFFAGDPALSAQRLVAQGREVVRGSDLAQAASGAYRLAASVCDALDNCAPAEGFLFGVDLAPPTVEQTSIQDRAVNPAASLALTLRDDLSGFVARPVEATAQLLDTNPATPVCGPTVEGVDLPGRPVAGSCSPDSVATVIPVPRSTPGYFNYTIVAFDRAGNRAPAVLRSILVDQDVPVVTSLTPPAQFVAGEDATLSASATDNLDLTEVAFRWLYPGPAQSAGVAIPFAASVSTGLAFDSALTTTATATSRMPFIRTLTYTAGGRSTVLVDSVQAAATDAAQQAAARSRAIARSSFGNDTSIVDPFPSISSAVALVDKSFVCTQSCVPNDATSARITVRVTDDSKGGAPFARMYFYRRSEDGLIVLLGSTQSVSTVDTGTQRTFTYHFDFTPPAGLRGIFTMLAVGVTSRGNGMITDLSDPKIDFYRR